MVTDKQFFLLNKQYLINFDAVKEVEHYFARKLLVKLTIDAPEKLLVAKEKARSFLEWLETPFKTASFPPTVSLAHKRRLRDPPLRYIACQCREIGRIAYPADIAIGPDKTKCPLADGRRGKKKVERDLVAFTPGEKIHPCVSIGMQLPVQGL
jgi:hypothetical protein